MQFLTVLLLAGLTSTSLAVLQAAQFTVTSDPRKDNVASEDQPKEPFIFKEEFISKEDVVIESTRPKSQESQLLHPLLQENSFRKAELQLEETTEPAPRAATTSEGKIAKIIHRIIKELGKAMEEVMKCVEDMIPSADGVRKP